MPDAFRHIDRSDLDDDFYLEICSRTSNLHPSQSLVVLDTMTNLKWTFFYNKERDIGFSIPYNDKIPAVKQLYLPQFIQQSRPIGAGVVNEEDFTLFFKNLREEFKYGVISFPRYHDTKNMRVRVNKRIDLQEDYSKISARYKPKFRNALKVSARHLKYIDSLDPVQFMCFYREQNNNGRISDDGFDRVQRVILKSLNKDNGLVCGTFNTDGDLMSAGFWLVNESYVLSGVLVSAPESRNLSGAHYIFDQVIRSYAGSDRVFDFCGSDMPGVALWMNHFRPEQQEYVEYTIDDLNPLIKGTIRAVKKVKSILK